MLIFILNVEFDKSKLLENFSKLFFREFTLLFSNSDLIYYGKVFFFDFAFVGMPKKGENVTGHVMTQISKSCRVCYGEDEDFVIELENTLVF